MCSYEELDPEVIPMVEYFNSVGLKTCMSCQGHNKTNMSMFWIQFAKTVTNEDIIAFQRKHADKWGGFPCNGRFVIRILANTKNFIDGVEYAINYMSATIEAAKEDLERWIAIDRGV